MDANISNLERCRETDLQVKILALNLHYKGEIMNATWLNGPEVPKFCNYCLDSMLRAIWAT